MKIGILGGTFDPVHNGHLGVAEEVKNRLGLKKVIFVPAGMPWMKSDREITSAEHRVAMLRLALAGRSQFELSLTEINRPGSTYTVETLIEFRREYGGETNIYFILGYDGLNYLPKWKNAGQLIKLCRIAVVPRPGFSLPDMAGLQKQLPGLSENTVLLDAPLIDVSATEVRQRVFSGQSIRRLVPSPVAKYIASHKLYAKAE